jgi:hypothetical protein
LYYGELLTDSRLFGWLAASPPDDSSGTYSLITIESVGPLDAAISKQVTQALISARIHDAFIAKARLRLSKPKYEKLLAAADPGDYLTRAGDFGEIVAAEALHSLFGYYLPVKKLRFKIRKEDQPTGIDIVAFKVAEDQRTIRGVCYTESKLRTTTNTTFARDAHDQLKRTWKAAEGELHVFVGSILEDKQDPVLNSFYDFLNGESGITVSFCLALHSDKDTWSNTALTNLHELPPTLEPLLVHLYRIEHLADAIKSCFDSIGIAIEDDDDD